MREIKFKCYIIDDNGKIDRTFNEWIDGDGWKHDFYSPLVTNGVFSHEELGDGFLGDIVRQQFTGLTDKNGKEIYEGDILRTTRTGGSQPYYKIWRGEGGFCINQCQGDLKKEPRHISFFEGLSDMQNASFTKGNCEVIGNIFENPELLEQ